MIWVLLEVLETSRLQMVMLRGPRGIKNPCWVERMPGCVLLARISTLHSKAWHWALGTERPGYCFSTSF